MSNYFGREGYALPREQTAPCGGTAASSTTILRAGHHWRSCSLVLMTKVDPTFGQIIRGHFYGDPITGKNSNAVFLHPTGRVGQGLVSIVESHAKPCVRKQLEHRTFKLDQIFLSQRA